MLKSSSHLVQQKKFIEIFHSFCYDVINRGKHLLEKKEKKRHSDFKSPDRMTMSRMDRQIGN